MVPQPQQSGFVTLFSLVLGLFLALPLWSVMGDSIMGFISHFSTDSMGQAPIALIAIMAPYAFYFLIVSLIAGFINVVLLPYWNLRMVKRALRALHEESQEGVFIQVTDKPQKSKWAKLWPIIAWLGVIWFIGTMLGFW